MNNQYECQAPCHVGASRQYVPSETNKYSSYCCDDCYKLIMRAEHFVRNAAEKIKVTGTRKKTKINRQQMHAIVDQVYDEIGD